MDLGEIETLAAVSRTGSISAAAKEAGVSVSTAARRLDALEARLKLRLVDRRANGARLTAEGLRLAALAEPLSAQLASISRAAEALRHGEGPALVRISATEAIIADILAPALPSLFSSAPGVSVQLQSQGEVVSLAGRDADLAIRMVRPSGASLIIRKLPELHIGLFASRHWLAGRTPDEIHLEDAPILTYDDSFGRIPELAWLESLGLAGAVRLRTGSTRALLTATLAGAGVGLLPRLFIRPGSGLVEIPTDVPPPTRTPWLAVHRDLRRLAPVAAAHRWIVAAFSAAVAQQLGGHL
jgi:molybdate transport repressor ModE-like protein